jgi:hypothetical protein
MECPPPLPDLARWLSQHFPVPPEGFEAGRRKIRSAVAAYVGCSADEAEQLALELERRGHLRYAAEGRAAGGSAGRWILYASPSENPEQPDAAAPG